MKKTILVDVDGVLVSWLTNLPFFMQENNICKKQILMCIDSEWLTPSEMFDVDSDEEGMELIKLYNRSKFIKYLPAYSDALKYVNVLMQKYNFVAISALGTTAECYSNRYYNLKSQFPEFGEVMLCDVGADKTDLIKQACEKYDVLFYVDDREKHCEEAMFSLPTDKIIRMRRNSTNFSKFQIANDWKAVYDYTKTKGL